MSLRRAVASLGVPLQVNDGPFFICDGPLQTEVGLFRMRTSRCALVPSRRRPAANRFNQQRLVARMRRAVASPHRLMARRGGPLQALQMPVFCWSALQEILGRSTFASGPCCLHLEIGPRDPSRLMWPPPFKPPWLRGPAGWPLTLPPPRLRGRSPSLPSEYPRLHRRSSARRPAFPSGRFRLWRRTFKRRPARGFRRKTSPECRPDGP